ncbi:hypothetical protein [Cypionkella psychrotolerans]|uniref:hypothetical protein n=1 Tax=Cypionkella psychrotolerans TaxID=1678131 RepID=UPI000B25B8C3|nr:hypothetical protein [Cypionkella psychrotolerans]
MRGLWIAVWLGLAGVAVADPFCKPSAAELVALPGLLVGDWQGEIVQGVAVQGGKPSLLPEGGQPTPATLAVAGAAISFADATTPQPVLLSATAATEDFALPGESPLGAEELLGPLMLEGGCAVGDLPQFEGAAAMAAGMAVRFSAFVLGKSQLLMVMQVGQVGPVAKPSGAGVRVVLRYSR